ncbi:MAG: type II secretion system protein GspD [Desulfobacteraceae bacterium]|nr:MAG: type II secretion system protein GspD [Desulfobacteraceae bacterium]
MRPVGCFSTWILKVLVLATMLFQAFPCSAQLKESIQEPDPTEETVRLPARKSLAERRAEVSRRLEALKRAQNQNTQEQNEGTEEIEKETAQSPAPQKSARVSPERKSPGEGERPKFVTMNFKNVELQSLIKLMSDLTGKNFIVDPSLKGQMTIISPNEISIDEAYQVFLSVLEVHGFTVIESKDVVKVIQAVEAKAKGLETRAGRKYSRLEDRMITQLMPLKHGDAADFAKFLGPLIPKTGLMVPYPDTNTLIVIDTVSNIDRLHKIVVELDVPGARDRIVIFPLESANAEKLATKLTNLFQRKEAGARASKDHVRIVSDDTTNSLIVMASSYMMSEIEEMVVKLDQKKLRKNAVRIYPLQHAVAEEVGKVLALLSGKGGEASTTSKDPKATAPVISKDTHISPDKATNSLIVIADPDEHQTIEELIKDLDAPRTMVYVEALIVEVSASKSLDLGVEWRAADSFNGGFRQGGNGGVVLGGSPGAAAVDAIATGKLPTGFTAGVVGKAITLGNVVFPSFGAFVKAIRSDTDFNVLSTPQILTLDNAEALIEVGQNIPFVTRVDQGTSVLDRSIQSFEYKDVGVTLKVTPQINDNRSVRLGIEQSVKSVLERTALGGTVLAPTTTFRRAKTAITVKDGETAVIGGLIENRLDRGLTETPCLGGIPAFGWLFKSTTDRDEKTNLLVFLSPHIVENPDESRELYQSKKSYTDGEMKRSSEHFREESIRRRLLE